MSYANELRDMSSAEVSALWTRIRTGCELAHPLKREAVMMEERRREYYATLDNAALVDELIENIKDSADDRLKPQLEYTDSIRAEVLRRMR
jgi:hypothetical protein